MLKRVPNLLTLLRFVFIVPIVVTIAYENFIASFAFLILSGATDVLDGIIARKFNCITDFGKLMDPLADKATQVSILVILTIKRIIPFWILAIVVLKEFAMISGASFLYGKELVVSSKWYGKLSTVLFYVAIICSLTIRYLNNVLEIQIYDFSIYIYYIALLATLSALVLYFKTFNMRSYIKEDKSRKSRKIN